MAEVDLLAKYNVAIDSKLSSLIVQDGPMATPYLPDGIMQVTSGVISTSSIPTSERNIVNVIYQPFGGLPGGVHIYGNTYTQWSDIQALATDIHVNSILNIYLDWTNAAGQPLPIGGIMGPLVRLIFNNKYTANNDGAGSDYPVAEFTPGTEGKTPTNFLVGINEIRGPFQFVVNGNNQLQTFLWPDNETEHFLKISEGAQLMFNYSVASTDIPISFSGNALNITIDNSSQQSSANVLQQVGGLWAESGSVVPITALAGQAVNIRILGGGTANGGYPGTSSASTIATGPALSSLNYYYDSSTSQNQMGNLTGGGATTYNPLSKAGSVFYDDTKQAPSFGVSDLQSVIDFLKSNVGLVKPFLTMEANATASVADSTDTAFRSYGAATIEGTTLQTFPTAGITAGDVKTTIAGRFLVTFDAAFDNNGTGGRSAWIAVNNAITGTDRRYAMSIIPSSGYAMTSGSVPINLNANDVVTLYMNQTSGGALNVGQLNTEFINTKITVCQLK